MRHAIFTAALTIAGFLIGLSCSRTTLVEVVKEVPVEVEKVIHDPPDTAAIESLEVRLKAANERAEQLWKEGWESGWHRGWDDKAKSLAGNSAQPIEPVGGQGSPARFTRWRSR